MRSTAVSTASRIRLRTSSKTAADTTVWPSRVLSWPRSISTLTETGTAVIAMARPEASTSPLTQFKASQEHQEEDRQVSDGAEDFVFRQAGQDRQCLVKVARSHAESNASQQLPDQCRLPQALGQLAAQARRQQQHQQDVEQMDRHGPPSCPRLHHTPPLPGSRTSDARQRRHSGDARSVISPESRRG